MKKNNKNKNISNHQKKRNKILYEIRKLCKTNPKIKQKIKHIKNINKRLYYAKVWSITETQPLYLLENSKKRGWKNYHLDHIFPIALGYIEKLSPKKVGNIKNLRFIPYKENLNKGARLTTESKKALRKIKRLRK